MWLLFWRRWRKKIKIVCLPLNKLLNHCLPFFIFLPICSQSRLPAVKVKYLMVAWFGALVASWVVYIQYSSYSELCRGHVCTMLIVSYCTTAHRMRICHHPCTLQITALIFNVIWSVQTFILLKLALEFYLIIYPNQM